MTKFKFIICIVAIVFAIAAWATSSSNGANNSNSVSTETEVSSSRESGKCVCGGSLTTDFKAFHHKEPCPNCRGKGYFEIGNYKQTCRICLGTKQITVYEAGYRCQSCGRVYRQW